MLSQSFIASLCLELGQALAAFGHDAEGCDVLRATADCFGSTNVASSVEGEAGKFLREVYTQLGLVTEKLHGTAAAHSVYELAVARGVWRHPLQRPQDVFQTSLRGLRLLERGEHAVRTRARGALRHNTRRMQAAPCFTVHLL